MASSYMAPTATCLTSSFKTVPISGPTNSAARSKSSVPAVERGRCLSRQTWRGAQRWQCYPNRRANHRARMDERVGESDISAEDAIVFEDWHVAA
jgi:hypothetical protein